MSKDDLRHITARAQRAVWMLVPFDFMDFDVIMQPINMKSISKFGSKRIRISLLSMFLIAFSLNVYANFFAN